MVRDVEYQKASFEDRYEVVQELGSGHFAVVRQCIERVTGNAYAAKYIRKRRQKFSRRGAAPEDIDNEIAILRSLKHDNIIGLHEVFEDDCHVILILELVSGGELFHYLSEREHLNEEDASRFVGQILRGLDHLHESNIAHLDLKPENILLSSNENQVIKIIDFGLAKRIYPGATELKCMMGTAEFVAPEIVNYEPLSLKTDLWSLGVITYMLLSGTSPFVGESQQDTFVNITSAEFDFDEENFATTSDLAKDFIRALLIRDPKKRLSTKQALEHPWIKPRNTHQIVKRKASAINMIRLKAFSAKRRWQKTLRVVKLCNRLSKGNNRPASTASLLSTDGSSEIDVLDVPENFVTRAIFCAIEDENRQGLERLLSMATVDVNCPNDLGVTAAHVASGAGRLRILQMLHVTYRLSLTTADNFGDTPLHWAARQDQKEIIEYLLESGSDAAMRNSSQETALFQAVRYGHECIFDILMNAMDADSINMPNADGDTCIHTSASYGSARCLQTLLKNPNIDKNAVNSRIETALHISAIKGAIRCVELLIAIGADCNQQDTSGFVPLVCALRNHQLEIVELLIPMTKLTTIDREGSSILHHAVEAENICLVELLMEKIPELVKKQNFTGETALHKAARYGHLEIARVLCSANADVETLDFQGLSPEVTALLNGHKETGKFLRLLSEPGFREKMLDELHIRQGHLDKFSVRVMGHARVGKTSLIKMLQTTAIGNLVRRGSALFRRKSAKKSPSKSPSMANLNQMRHGYPLFSYNNISLLPDFEVGVFDLSSDPLCLQFYSHLIRCCGCLNVIVFSLADSAQVQREQVSFWLRLLSLSAPSTEPVGYAGKSPNCPLVLLVGTHGDTVKCNKNSSGFLTNPVAFTLVETMKRHFGTELTILPTVFVTDNGTKNTGNIAGLKNFLATVGRQLRTRQYPPSVVLKKITNRLPIWRGTTLLLSFSDWMKLVQVEINPLITKKECLLLIDQLVFMGEILTIKESHPDHHVFISPHYLLNQLVMPFLYGQLHLKNPRHLFRSRDLHFIFSNYWHNTVEVVKGLEILGTCSPTGSGEATVYEFPILVDKTPAPRFLNNDMTIRVRTPDLPYFPMLVFPRIAARIKSSLQLNQQLNMTTMHRAVVFGDSIILKWDSQDESLEISAVGEKAVNIPVLQDICAALNEAIIDVLPSVLVEFAVLSDGQQVVFTNFDEIKADDLSMALLCRLCRMLDPKHSIGQDWCLLAVKLGLYEALLPKLAVVNSTAPSESTTYLLLKEWKKEKNPGPSINRLLLELESIDRKDVADLLKTFIPVYKMLYSATLDNTSSASPSEKTLSSMSSLTLSR